MVRANYLSQKQGADWGLGNKSGLTPHWKSKRLQCKRLGRVKNLSVHIQYEVKWTTHVDIATPKARLRMKSSQTAEEIQGFTEGPAILTGS